MAEMWIVKVSFLQLSEEDDEYLEFMDFPAMIGFVTDWAKKDDVEISITKQFYVLPGDANLDEMPF